MKYDLLHAKKSTRIFEKNPQKSIFSLLEGSNGFHPYIQSCLFLTLRHMLIIHHNAKTTLKATFKTFAKNICKNISKVAFRVALALWCIVTNMFKIRNKQLCIHEWKPLDPSKVPKNVFLTIMIAKNTFSQGQGGV